MSWAKQEGRTLKAPRGPSRQQAFQLPIAGLNDSGLRGQLWGWVRKLNLRPWSLSSWDPQVSLQAPRWSCSKG